jgi:hypothetical protein
MSFDAVLEAEKLDLGPRCCDATASCLFIGLEAFSLGKWPDFENGRNVASRCLTLAGSPERLSLQPGKITPCASF